jgi:hypothetical protein
MNKKIAIKLLGGTAKHAADAIGVTLSAIYRWPPVLTRTLRDRVDAALGRQAAYLADKPKIPAELLEKIRLDQYYALLSAENKARQEQKKRAKKGPHITTTTTTTQGDRHEFATR